MGVAVKLKGFGVNWMFPPVSDFDEKSLEEKCAFMFAYYDKDKDGFLNFAELNQLQQDTEGEGMSEEDWTSFAEAIGYDVATGPNLEQFTGVYKTDMGDVDKDYPIVKALAT